MSKADTDKLIWGLYSIVNVRGEVANVAICAIKATLPYVEDPETATALEKAAEILDGQLVVADDVLWQQLTHGRSYATD